MWPGTRAARTPGKPAYVMAATGEVVTYAELDARSNQLAQLFYARGLRFGDHIALCLENSPRFLEVTWAAQRSGLIYTAINYHLTAEEIAYIVQDCDAQAFVTSAAQAATAAALRPHLPASVHTRLVVGGHLPGFEPYETAVAEQPAEPLPEEIEGGAMLYSSGTTGRPKASRSCSSGSPWAHRCPSWTASRASTAWTKTPSISRRRRSTTPRRCTSA